MTDQVIIAIVTGGFSLITLIITSLLTYKMAKMKQAQDVLQTNQDDLHKQINSRMDELLALNRKDAKQEGKDEEIAKNQ